MINLVHVMVKKTSKKKKEILLKYIINWSRDRPKKLIQLLDKSRSVISAQTKIQRKQLASTSKRIIFTWICLWCTTINCENKFEHIFLRSLPGKRVLDVISSAIMHPTDQMSTERQKSSWYGYITKSIRYAFIFRGCHGVPCWLLTPATIRLDPKRFRSTST